MDGGRSRRWFIPLRLDPDVWEPRLGRDAVRRYHLASALWAVSVALYVLIGISWAVWGVLLSTAPEPVFFLGGALFVVAPTLLVVSIHIRQAFVYRVAENLRVPWSAVSLRSMSVRDSAAFDQWLAEQRARTAGWYVDPETDAAWRWWDGWAWTEHRAPR